MIYTRWYGKIIHNNFYYVKAQNKIINNLLKDYNDTDEKIYIKTSISNKDWFEYIHKNKSNL